MRDFDDNDIPLAYFITFRCYGTWLHGDERRSMDRTHNKYGTPKIAPNERLERSDKRQLKHPSIELTPTQRAAVASAIRQVCEHRR